VAEFDSVIPAGQSGTLTAKVKTRLTQNGPASKSIAVTTDSPGAERIMLALNFTAVSVVSVLPRPQITLNAIVGDEPQTTLVLHRADGKELEIRGVVSDEPRIVITTKPVTEAQMVGRLQAKPGDVVLTASIAPNVEPVIANGRIKLETNHPDAPEVDINYGLRIRAVIEANPPQLRLLLQDGNSSARTMLFRVQDNRGGRFKLTGAKPSNPELFRVELLDGDAEAQVHQVAVMLQDDVLPGALESSVFESLVLSTDDSAQPELTVPIHIEPRELRRPAQPRPLD